jgi:hypothetical protein
MVGSEWQELMRTRAAWLLFRAVTAMVNGQELAIVRLKLMEAVEAIDATEKSER